MGGPDKVLLICGCLLVCLIELSECLAPGQSGPPAILSRIPPPPGARCSRGCNMKHTRCVEYPEGCGKGHFKTCQCKPGYFLVDGVCKKYREVDDKCKEADDICPGTCSSGKCKCPNDIYSKDKELCGRRYDETCSSNGECSWARGNATCNSGKCGCATGLVYQIDYGKRCLPRGGGSCTADDQCYGGQSCVSTACACASGQKWDKEGFSCVNANALTGVSKGSDCTPDRMAANAKVCAFGLHCFTCDPVLPLHRCVKFPNAASTLCPFFPLFTLILLVSFAL